MYEQIICYWIESRAMYKCFATYMIIPLHIFRAKHLMFELHTLCSSWIAPWSINAIEGPPISHFLWRRAKSAKSLHMGASAIPMKRKRLLEHTISVAMCRLCVGDVCVSWPAQGTAVQFNIMDEEQRPWFQFQPKISNHKLLFIF